ncbi:precorrin-6Y C5,15-methyltransferase (decarboxylating) [Rubrimonas cliftonensis]|uniref:Precorrin-6Y C5,15-methyltransferase (Decarboxylating) n=1 Tax=Rubrimonas cliftonensis TaxID=89524 RepID=A0A1H4FWL6_9RHOB|nr:precorrin-6Y C5,15-methyltransferase (decarboxylating) [Rubrimonas cliftonensis]
MAWPAPFADGLPLLQGLRGRRAVALASGDPFWFGAGGAIARALAPGEWTALPYPSTFSLAAARLGWPLERIVCLGLHAAPLARLRPYLAPGARVLILLRDGAAMAALADWLTGEGFGATRLHALEALGGPRERVTTMRADAPAPGPFAHPVAAALEAAGDGLVLPCASGLADSWFDSDGQITKRPVRALTLSALAPRPGERLWDIGGGSGSVAIEWLLSHPAAEAVSVERRPDRAARIRANAARLGVDRLEVVEGAAPEALDGLPRPDAVFVGGGLSAALLAALEARLAPRTRLVVNAVTLETEALLLAAHARRGGALLRVALAEAAPLGCGLGWTSARPLTQWSATL